MAEEKLTEIRWHARGGQGAVTAAKLLAETALSQGQYFQAFPEYGPERMGAPIRAYTRISKNPIYIRSSITNPGIVTVLDPTLLGVVDVAAGLDADGALIVNTNKTPAEIREQMGLTGHKIYTVDASKIAKETIGRAIPNTPMMGALVKILGTMSIDDVAGYVRKSFGKKFSEEIIEGNVKAVKRAYAEVKGE
ncbi:MAG TPA: 2-oxoacid:acceptor oxidoreductase family protein [Candidatus Aquicultor sp.]|jgi:pyruvate ferredoxin oxidoreductase gamma subunit